MQVRRHHGLQVAEDEGAPSFHVTLEGQLPIYWVPVLKSLYKSILPVAQGPTIWVPGLLG